MGTYIMRFQRTRLPGSAATGRRKTNAARVQEIMAGEWIKIERSTSEDGVMDYSDFVGRKLGIVRREGIAADVSGYSLFPHQSDLTAWALRRGAAAIFADTGLGKSRMQLAWADTVCRHTGRRADPGAWRWRSRRWRKAKRSAWP